MKSLNVKIGRSGAVLLGLAFVIGECKNSHIYRMRRCCTCTPSSKLTNKTKANDKRTKLEENVLNLSLDLALTAGAGRNSETLVRHGQPKPESFH
jgi:hypothetical protein